MRPKSRNRMLSQGKHKEAMDKLHLGFQCKVSSQYFKREIWEMGSVWRAVEAFSWDDVILQYDSFPGKAWGCFWQSKCWSQCLPNISRYRFEKRAALAGSWEASLLLIKPAQMYFTLETAFLSLISILARTIQPVWQHCESLEWLRIAFSGGIFCKAFSVWGKYSTKLNLKVASSQLFSIWCVFLRAIKRYTAAVFDNYFETVGPWGSCEWWKKLQKALVKI